MVKAVTNGSQDRREQLLLILVQLVARIAWEEDTVRRIVAPRQSAETQRVAYNLCDGSRTQRQVAREAGIDEGNFSRTARRWIDAGVLFKVGSEGEEKLLHLFPLRIDSQDRE